MLQASKEVGPLDQKPSKKRKRRQKRNHRRLPLPLLHHRSIYGFKMAFRVLAARLRSRLTPALREAILHPCIPSPSPPDPPLLLLRSAARHLSTAASRRHPSRSRPVDIGARARQLQNRRLWTYAVTFSCVAGFIVVVLANFQDQMVFYITPTDALQRFAVNPSNSRFRLGGLVLEGSVAHPNAASPEMEFVITDLITDILVRYEGSLPDLFREGHSVVVEGFIRPFSPEEDGRASGGCPAVSGKARSGECFFKATEVLAKHDEKYMPKEVAVALERNKKKIEAEAKGGEKRAEAQT